MADIIQIGEIRLERQAKNSQCKHLRLGYSEREQTIECLDCQMQIPPFRALMILVSHYNQSVRELSSRRSQLEELERRSGKGLLLATKRVDHAWRSRTMVPTCPHCGRGIGPSDGFGGSCINQRIEAERRKFEHPQPSQTTEQR